MLLLLQWQRGLPQQALVAQNRFALCLFARNVEYGSLSLSGCGYSLSMHLSMIYKSYAAHMWQREYSVKPERLDLHFDLL